MPRNMKKSNQSEQPPVLVDDFIYDDSDFKADSSDTPEQAVEKLRRQMHPSDSSLFRNDDDNVSDDDDVAFIRSRRRLNRNPRTSEERPPRTHSDGNSEEEAPGETTQNNAEVNSVHSIGTDDNLPSARSSRGRFFRIFRLAALGIITFVLLLLAGMMILHGIDGTIPGLDFPENLVSGIITPVQSGFTSISDRFFAWSKSLQLRANIESAYEQLRIENEQLVYEAMLAEELKHTLRQYEDLSDEIAANEAMRPIVATIVGRGDPTYFSTMTINKGSLDGVENYMAVTFGGALVGYTESVTEHKATVRTIIDSDASIAALIQSSRDQGTVRGTLGIDGKPLCRMYYLPDDNLPRPGDLIVTSGVGMSFPKGIPIGVVRESTRGMESNKQFIVLEPQVDFQHLEYVIVLRYKPEPEAIEGRENGRSSLDLVPLTSARPSPVIPQIAASLFESPSPAPSGESSVAAATTPTPEPTMQATATPPPSAAVQTPDLPAATSLEYQVINLSSDPTPSPTPSPAPTSTPYWTPDPNDMIFEED